MEIKTFFRTVQHFGTDYSVAEFWQYESERTGMRVVVVNQKGPKLHGYFVLATEIHDDSGARTLWSMFKCHEDSTHDSSSAYFGAPLFHGSVPVNSLILKQLL
jgi:hypothetical protein